MKPPPGTADRTIVHVPSEAVHVNGRERVRELRDGYVYAGGKEWYARQELNLPVYEGKTGNAHSQEH